MTRGLRRGTGLSDEGGGYAVGQLPCFCIGWDHSAVLHRVWRGCFAAAAPVRAVQRGGEPGRHNVDLDIPLLREYPHWLIWNLSPTQEIPAAIPPGESLPELHDAAQGVAYGVHRYRGPKPPLWVRNTHSYRFDVYVLDCRLALDSQARLRDLRRAMKGHILQRGSLIGKYRHSQPFGSRTLTGERSI